MRKASVNEVEVLQYAIGGHCANAVWFAKDYSKAVCLKKRCHAVFIKNRPMSVSMETLSAVRASDNVARIVFAIRNCSNDEATGL